MVLERFLCLTSIGAIVFLYVALGSFHTEKFCDSAFRIPISADDLKYIEGRTARAILSHNDLIKGCR